MTKDEHVLISLEERHAENIFSGRKRVELRRRPMKVSIGATVWIYVKLPVGSMMGCARVSDSYVLAPSTLWRRFSGVSGLTRDEFFDYYDGVSTGFALALKDVERLPRSISLDALREALSGFQPPQFFKRIDADSPLLSIVGAL